MALRHTQLAGLILGAAMLLATAFVFLGSGDERGAGAEPEALQDRVAGRAPATDFANGPQSKNHTAPSESNADLTRAPTLDPELTGSGVWIRVLDRWTGRPIPDAPVEFALPQTGRRIEAESVQSLHRLGDARVPVGLVVRCPGYLGRDLWIREAGDATFDNPAEITLSPYLERTVCVVDGTGAGIPPCQVRLTPMYATSGPEILLATDAETGCATTKIEIGEPGDRAYLLAVVEHEDYGKRQWCVPLERWTRPGPVEFRLEEPGLVEVTLAPDSGVEGVLRVLDRRSVGPFARELPLHQARYSRAPQKIGPFQPGRIQIDASHDENEQRAHGREHVDVVSGETTQVTIEVR